VYDTIIINYELNKSNRHTGKVILAGAGPGDPDLITVKAVKALQSADVVLADRLVSRDIIDRYVRSGTTVIEVGKQCRRGVSTPQETINDLMLKYALQGKQIVRLKGGDISFFSNVLDELKVLVENEVPYELIPGVTAASGAAAYAGIPLTARGHAVAVRFVTYYKPEIISDDYWKELAQTDDTLVFYMSSETLEELTDKLVVHGIDNRKKMAVIEQATTPYQQVYMSPVHAYRRELGGRSFLSPSLVIIGNVVNLHETFQWFVCAPDGEHYFKPLTGAVESIVNDVKKKYADRA
jgi:uroporphyrin-III C-methyltransferase